MPDQAKDKKNKIFGVYQMETGSYTLGEVRFTPGKAVACTETTKDLACEDESPVKFFADEAEANKAVAALKAKFELRRKPKDREE